jgi:hypothetical protein
MVECDGDLILYEYIALLHCLRRLCGHPVRSPCRLQATLTKFGSHAMRNGLKAILYRKSSNAMPKKSLKTIPKEEV